MSIRLLIVGGVAGGASAAARARRIDENATIILFERGEFVSFANCGLPYYIGEEIKERDDLLVTTPQKLRDRFNIDVRVFSEVVSIDRKNKMVEVRDLRDGRIYTESYDKLILSPGAAPIKPPLPGIDLDSVFTLRTIPDADRIKATIDRDKPAEAVVVGGGFIGLEMAENLVNRGIKVTIVEMLDQVMAPLDYEMAALVHEHLVDKGIVLRLKECVKSFKKKNGKTIVTTQSGTEIECDIVILSIGVKPEAELARKAGLEMGVLGGIKTDEYMRTSDPDIFAIGDAVEVKDFISGQSTIIPLAGPANKQGRIAADNALGRKSKYSGTQGSAVVKVFDLTVASTGNNEKTLKRRNAPYKVSHSHSGSHASYYPNAQMMAIKLLFEPGNGKILGAQIVGKEGVDKRIDVIATAIRAGMTVFDLAELELAYAPPYSSAKDPVNIAGLVASNLLKGDVEFVYWDEIDHINPETEQILDVRDKVELDITGAIPNSIHIPLNDLRNNLSKLDKEKTYIAYCAVGQRSYFANRILTQNGFKCKTLSGGWKTYYPTKKELKTEVAKAGIEKKMSTELASFDGTKVDYEINACGIQCPGPILKLKKKIDEMKNGETVKICASDTGFQSDIKAWCSSTGNEIVSLESDKGVFTAIVRKGTGLAETGIRKDGKEITIIVFSDDLDRALAAFIIANGAASIGSKVNMFFTFWGLNILKKKESPKEKKDLLSAMFGAMMPKGPDQLALSKMHFAGLGTEMMKYVMKNKNVDSLDVLIESAREQGVRLVACTMTMEIMGIKMSELIDGIDEGGVASYLENASKANVNLFI